jgi:hypothetical protein
MPRAALRHPASSRRGRGEQVGMSTKGWSVTDIPDLTGVTAVVTGANPG